MTKSLKDLINTKKLFVFDFDGVLADSVNVKTQAFASLYEKYGAPVVHKVIMHHEKNGGMSRFEKFKHYHKTFLGKNLNKLEIQKMSEKFSAMVIKKVIASEWIHGAKNYLDKLYEAKNNCVVISATPLNEIRHIIDKRDMNKYFSIVCGSPSTKHDNLEHVMRKFSICSKEIVFFGDSIADWEAASKKDILFVGIGATIKDLLKNEKKPKIFVDDFEIIES